MNEDYYAIGGRLSNSKFKRYDECACRAYAEDCGEYVRPVTEAFLTGSYVDAALFGEEFDLGEHYHVLYTQKDTLRSTYSYLEHMVQDAQNDAEFMAALQGSYQDQALFEIDGLPWKAKSDVLADYDPDLIVDLKTVGKMSERMFSKRFGCYVPFYYGRGYDIQGCVYREAFQRQKFQLAMLSKKKEVAGRYLMDVPKGMLDQALVYVKKNQELVFEQMQGRQIDFCNDEDCRVCRERKVTIAVSTPWIEDMVTKEATPF